jgi:cobyrinic acid a,c-diamide synthase
MNAIVSAGDLMPSGRSRSARLLLSAAHKSSGKTTIALGLASALTRRGTTVQTFKKGPDYIDPMWLARASARPCYNLDPYLMPTAQMRALFRRHAEGCDLALVEGNKGLYDGLALDGSNSNAAVAVSLELPVILVLDARGMTRGVAPLILGYQAFDRRVRIVGVILNRLGGARHEGKLRAVIEHYTDVKVLGAVHESLDLAIDERHLGLIPSTEASNAEASILRIGAAVAAQVDLDLLLATAEAAPMHGAGILPPARARGPSVRIGIARDRAFGFYYSDDLEALADAGAELVPFDALHDSRLPAVDGLFIGGGFPETSAPHLEANVPLRAQIRAAVEAGLPVYAECGGLMYLARSLTVAGRRHQMVGAIGADVVMHARPVGRGYVELVPTGSARWPVGTTPGARILAHEFHYSSLENIDPELQFAYCVARGHGIDGCHDGLLRNNLVASYSHLRSVGDCDWARRFVEFVQSVSAAGSRRNESVPDEQGSLVE